jgi:hypothetical protein
MCKITYSKKQLQKVLISILKPEQIEGLGIHKAAEEAAITLFIQDGMYSSQEYVDVLRQAICDLRDSGCFNYASATEE